MIAPDQLYRVWCRRKPRGTPVPGDYSMSKLSAECVAANLNSKWGELHQYWIQPAGETEGKPPEK